MVVKLGGHQPPMIKVVGLTVGTSVGFSAVEKLGGVHPPSIDVIGSTVEVSSVEVVVLGVVQSGSVVGASVSGTVVVVKASVVEVVADSSVVPNQAGKAEIK